MKRLIFVFILLFSLPSFAQLWSGVLDPNRAVDWTGAGVVGGIPSATWTQINFDSLKIDVTGTYPLLP